MEKLFTAETPEAYFEQISEQRSRERDRCSEFASVVAYQQLLLNHLSMSYIKMKQSDSTMQRSVAVPSLEYPAPGTMKESNLAVPRQITDLVARKLAAVPTAGQIPTLFRDLHGRFSDFLANGSRLKSAKIAFAEFCQAPTASTIQIESEKSTRVSTPEIDKLARLVNNEYFHCDGKNTGDMFKADSRAMYYIYSHAKHDLTVDTLESIYQGLVRTNQELLNSIGDSTMEQSKAIDAISFPGMDVIKSSTDYEAIRQYHSSNAEVMMQLQTKAIDFRSIFDATMTELLDFKTNFGEAFVWPNLQDDVIEMLVKKETDRLVTQRTLLVFKEIVKHARIRNPSQWAGRTFVTTSVGYLRDIVNLLKQKDYDQVQSVLYKYLDYVSDGSDNGPEKMLKAEIGKVEESTKNAVQEMNRWHMELQRRAERKPINEAKRQETLGQQNELRETRNEVKRELSDSITEMSTAVDSVVSALQVSPDWETQMNTISAKLAHKEWLMARLAAQRARVSAIQKEISSLEQESADLNKRIEAEKKMNVELKERQRTQTYSQGGKNKEFEDTKAMVYCGSCEGKSNKRSRFLDECGHSFCAECLDTKITKNRTRRCPHCNQPVTQYSIQKIIWPDE